jgi:large subunit ribosomal protein L4
MKAPLYNQKGEKKGDLTLNATVFGVEASEGLIHEYLTYQRANARRPIAHVKNRSEVRGGGRKPFRQKGTGRARQGSIRNPILRGGGAAFGPKKCQTFEKMMPKKMRVKALLGILGNKVKAEKVLGLDKFDLKEPKTKDFATMLAKLPVTRNVLVVANREEKALRMSARNHKNAKVITSGYLNPADLLKYDHVLLTEAALKDIEATYVKKQTAKQ